MTPIEILKDLFFIERGYLNANHFVYRSKNPVLIDTAYIADFDETRRRINNLDIKLTDISLIISTHSHCDHIGGNKFIQDESISGYLVANGCVDGVTSRKELSEDGFPINVGVSIIDQLRNLI